MPDPAIATAADYADAIMIARRAKNTLILLLLLILLTQITLFFIARYTDLIITAPPPAAVTQPVDADTPLAEPAPTAEPARWQDVFHYFLGLTVFAGIAFSLVLSVVLLLIVMIMLVGRLIGVARTTSAFIWCLVLIVLLFPWQAFLRDELFTSREWIWSGVLYTWDELRLFAHFPGTWSSRDEIFETSLRWIRFVIFPIAAVILLLVIMIKSNRGLRQALGESYIVPEPAADV